MNFSPGIRRVRVSPDLLVEELEIRSTIMAHKQAASEAAITYTPASPLRGPTFTCPRCARVYSYPHDHGAPVRCECGWWYTNLGHGRIVEEFRPRIGGAKVAGPEAAADEGARH